MMCTEFHAAIDRFRQQALAWVTLLISISTLHAHGHWIPEHPSPSAGNFYGSWVFENDDVLLTTGGGFSCLYTAESDSWEYSWITDNDEVDHLKELQMITGQTGYAIGFIDWFENILYRTDNRGRNWSHVTTCPLENVRAFYFLSSDSGFVGGNNAVYRTLDGGESWTLCLADSNVTVDDIFFFNNQSGWLTSSGREGVYHTTDFGATWELQDVTVEWPEHIRFFAEERGILQSRYGSQQTTNGGETWIPFLHNSLNLELVDWVHTGNFSFGASPANHYIRSFDNGETWEYSNNQYPDFEYLYTQTVGANSSGKVVLAGERGYYDVSHDYGHTFFPDSGLTDQSLRIIEVQPTHRYWVSGALGVILTKDGEEGAWQRYEGLSDREGVGILDITFKDESDGWICINAPYLLKTEDGGETWQEVGLGLEESDHPYELLIKNNQDYVVFSAQGVIKESSDGGESWSLINDSGPTAANKNPVEYVDDQNLWVGSGSLYHSSDGGRHWEVRWQVNCPEDEGLRVYDIYFRDSQTGFAIISHLMGNGNGDFGRSRILWTTDGGQTWNDDPNREFGSPLHEIDFFDDTHGIAVGGNGHSYYTDNGGESWNWKSMGTDIFLYSVNCIDSETCYAVGQRGAIYKLNNVITDIAEDVVSSSLPTSLNITTYPNPFNQSVMITCDIPGASDLDIRIYNLNGREVCRLTTGKGARGMNRFCWDGKDSAGNPVSSGVYFVAVRDGTQVKAQKILLVR